MHRAGIQAAVVLLVVLSTCELTRAAVSGLQLVASGITAPVYIAHAPGDRDRLFIVENGFPFEGQMLVPGFLS